MPGLSAFQARFAEALLDPDLPGPTADRLGLAVYRNTVGKGLIEALRAAFPAVERVVGEAWFAAAATVFIRQSPPTGPIIADYGEGFADFLEGFAPAAQLSYLADVARIDRMWLSAHLAADGPALSRADLAGLDPHALLALPVRLHPAAQVAWFDGPAPSLWRLNRQAEPDAEALAGVLWRPEGLALSCPAGRVIDSVLTTAQYLFLAACDDLGVLGEAIARALAADPAADPLQVLGASLDQGLIAPRPLPDPAPSRQEIAE